MAAWLATTRQLAAATSAISGSRSTPVAGAPASAIRSPPIPQHKSATGTAGENRLALYAATNWSVACSRPRRKEHARSDSELACGAVTQLDLLEDQMRPSQRKMVTQFRGQPHGRLCLADRCEVEPLGRVGADEPAVVVEMCYGFQNGGCHRCIFGRSWTLRMTRLARSGLGQLSSGRGLPDLKDCCGVSVTIPFLAWPLRVL